MAYNAQNNPGVDLSPQGTNTDPTATGLGAGQQGYGVTGRGHYERAGGEDPPHVYNAGPDAVKIVRHVYDETPQKIYEAPVIIETIVHHDVERIQPVIHREVHQTRLHEGMQQRVDGAQDMAGNGQFASGGTTQYNTAAAPMDGMTGPATSGAYHNNVGDGTAGAHYNNAAGPVAGTANQAAGYGATGAQYNNVRDGATGAYNNIGDATTGAHHNTGAGADSQAAGNDATGVRHINVQYGSTGAHPINLHYGTMGAQHNNAAAPVAATADTATGYGTSDAHHNTVQYGNTGTHYNAVRYGTDTHNNTAATDTHMREPGGIKGFINKITPGPGPFKAVPE